MSFRPSVHFGPCPPPPPLPTHCCLYLPPPLSYYILPPYPPLSCTHSTPTHIPTYSVLSPEPISDSQRTTRTPIARGKPFPLSLGQTRVSSSAARVHPPPIILTLPTFTDLSLSLHHSSSARLNSSMFLFPLNIFYILEQLTFIPFFQL